MLYVARCKRVSQRASSIEKQQQQQKQRNHTHWNERRKGTTKIAKQFTAIKA